MIVKLTQLRFGPGCVQQAGTVIDLPDGEAAALIASGNAIAVAPPVIETAAKAAGEVVVEPATQIETAAVAPPENSALRTSAPPAKRATGRKGPTK